MGSASPEEFIMQFLEVVPDTHLSDYTYLNLIELHIDRIEACLQELSRRRDDEAAQRLVMRIWHRMRRYYELRGKYSEGVRMAPVFREAALSLDQPADAAWILLKDDLWLRVLRGDQGPEMPARFEQAAEEFAAVIAAPQTHADARRDAAVGRFTVFRYIVGFLRHYSGAFALPKSRLRLSRRDALLRCQQELAAIEASGVLPASELGELRARFEQTSGSVDLSDGDVEGALSHYTAAYDLYHEHASEDEEHLAIAECYLAQTHLHRAARYSQEAVDRGAFRLSRESREARRSMEADIGVALGYLHEASTHANRVGWEEGRPRIAEHLAGAFRLQGHQTLPLMFARESLEGYLRLGSQKNVGRMESVIEDLRRQGMVPSSGAGCDVLVVSRMHGEEDDRKLEAIKEACARIRVDDEPLRARRVDDVVNAGGRITDALIDHLWNAKLIVAVLDGQRPNVYWELGLAHGCGHPVILCVGSAEMDEIPFDLKDFSLITYRDPAELAARLVDPITAELQTLGLHPVLADDAGA